MKITPRNWARFQHYNTRRPPWIKLHRGLLDDYQFHTLPLASKALAPLLWLLASEHKGLQNHLLKQERRQNTRQMQERQKPRQEQEMYLS